MPETIEIELEIDVNTCHSCSSRASILPVCDSKKWMYPPLITKCQCCPGLSCAARQDKRKPMGHSLLYFCFTKMLFNTCAYGCNISENISGYRLVTERHMASLFPNSRTRWGCWQLGVRRPDFFPKPGI